MEPNIFVHLIIISITIVSVILFIICLLLKTLFRSRFHQYCYRSRLRRQRRNRSNHNNVNDEDDRFEPRRMYIKERIIVEVCM